MKVTPMLGSFELPGIEYIESTEGRALAEHRVPGLAGSYFQDLGTAANTVVVRGSRFGDEPRDAFLTSIREIFNAGTPTTFVADINTATDITDVIIEDLQVSESAVDAGFRYVVRLRKYTKPPEPPAAGFPGLDGGLLDAAMGAMAVLEALDALASLPDLGNPTEPLLGALDGVKSATAALDSVQSDLSSLVGADLLSEMPAPEALSSSLSAVVGDEDSGVTAVGDLLAALNPAGLSVNVSLTLDDGMSASLDVTTPPGLDQFRSTIAALPSDPAALTAALGGRFDALKDLAATALRGRLATGIDGIDAVLRLLPDDPTTLLSGVSGAVDGLKGEVVEGAFADVVRWATELDALRLELEPLVTGDGSVEDRLLGYVRGKVLDVVAQVLPPDLARLPRFVRDLDLALELPSGLPELTASVAAAFDSARIEFEAGNVTNTAAFDGAVVAFDALVDALEHVVAVLRAPLESIADGAEAVLSAQYDNIERLEIVDVGDIREIFAKAIARVQALIDGFDLPSARDRIEALFAQLDSAVDEFDLPNLFGGVADVQRQFDDVLGSLDGALYEATATVRTAFADVRHGLEDLLSSVGSFGADGTFRFSAQDDLEGFLDGVRDTLETTLKPVVETFQATVRGALSRVQTLLSGVQADVEAVRQQLDAALLGVLHQLEAVDVPGTMQGMRAELEAMLATLGEFDFDPVVDPVIAQLEDMKGVLAKIDVSAMGDVQIGALKVSVKVVAEVDFGTQISATLMGELDELLQVPFDALAAVEASVETTLAAFAAYGPDAILAPLKKLFAPISAALDALDLDVLAAPLNDWHGGLMAQLDAVSPRSLLAPLADLHAQLAGTVAKVSPAVLASALDDAVAGLRADLGALDLGQVVGALGDVAAGLRDALARFSPAQLLEPLVGAFDAIVAALDAFDPTVILAPLKAVFETLAEPVQSLTADAAARLAVVLAPLHELLALCDPRALFARLATVLSGARNLLAAADIGGVVAALTTSYAGMSGAFSVQSGGASLALAGSVESVDPARNARLTALTADVAALRTRVDALAAGEPPAALTARYDAEIKPRLDKIIPFWARQDVTPASVQQAFAAIDPFALDTEVRALYQSLKDKLLGYDPRAVQAVVQASFDHVVDKLAALGPDAIGAQVDLVLGSLTARLDALDLGAVTAEVSEIADDVTALIAAVDPQRVVDALDERVQAVLAQAEELRPITLLAGLDEPLAAARAIVGAFDPQALIDALQATFAQIQGLVAQVDVGILLEPLVKRLQQLRSELKSALERTEAAFNGMLAAVPV